jgi:signal recognition particle subunit SRP72
MAPKLSQTIAARRIAFTPKPARPIAGRIHHLHRSLVDQINAGHLTNGIKTCQKILSLLSDEKDVPEEIKIEVEGETITATKQEIKTNALQTLLFLLLQTDQYDIAMETIESASQSDKLDFEKAYCLYRLHEEEKAKELVEKLRATEGGSVGLEHESARRLAHLEAQIVSRSLEAPGASKLIVPCRAIEREITPSPRRSITSFCQLAPLYVSSFQGDFT